MILSDSFRGKEKEKSPSKIIWEWFDFIIWSGEIRTKVTKYTSTSVMCTFHFHVIFARNLLKSVSSTGFHIEVAKKFLSFNVNKREVTKNPLRKNIFFHYLSPSTPSNMDRQLLCQMFVRYENKKHCCFQRKDISNIVHLGILILSWNIYFRLLRKKHEMKINNYFTK